MNEELNMAKFEFFLFLVPTKSAGFTPLSELIKLIL